MAGHAGLRRRGTWTLTDSVVVITVIAAIIGTFVTAGGPPRPPHHRPAPSSTSIYANPVPEPTGYEPLSPDSWTPSDPSDDYTYGDPTDEPTEGPVEDPAVAGPTAVCMDGWVSYSQHRQGTCSHHGGVAYWVTSATP